MSRKSCSSTSRQPAWSVELRRDMWSLVRSLRESRRYHHPHHPLHRGGRGDGGRIGVINKGELVLVEDKAALMRKLGKKQLTLQLARPA